MASACATNRVLFRGAGLRIEDYRCRAPRSAAGALEVSDAHYVVLVRRGAFERHVGSRSAIATPASAVFFEPGLEYRVAHPRDGGDECTVIRVDPGLLAELLDSLGIDGADRPSFPAGLVAPAPAVACLRQWQLLLLLRRGDADTAAREDLALALLAAAVEGAARRGGARVRKPATRRGHERLVAHAVEILAARYVAPPGLHALARELAASPFHLCRVFRAHTGHSIHGYVTELRVREALRRIAGGERDLLRLALELGFCHHGHLGRAFARSFGRKPSSVRALLARRDPGAAGARPG